MKAAVMYGVGQPLVIEELNIEEPQVGEVLIKTGASGVCHSDLHFMEGSWMFPTPVVLGHESAGIAEKVGPGVTNVKPGDRVVIAFVASCGTCDRCVTGRPNLCSNASPMGRPGRISKDGSPVFQFASMGAFAEQQLVDAKACVHVPDGVPLEVACLVGCSVMTGVGAAINTARVEPGSSVFVIGAGGVGLNVIQGCAIAGAGIIVAVDMADNKLELAKQFGATHTLNAGKEENLVKAVKKLTGGGADYAFECIGLGKMVEQAFRALRKGGTALVVGVARGEDQTSLKTASITFEEKTLTGSYYGSARPREDFPRLIALYQAKKLKLDELITRTYGIDEAAQAFADLEAGRNARGVIVFG